MYKILMLEDNNNDVIFIREIIQQNLFKNYFPEKIKIISTDQIKAGLEIIRREEVNLIFLDLQLKEENGFELLTNHWPEIENIPVIVFTGDNRQDLAMEALKLGAQDFIGKGDFDALSLAKTIKYALERHKILNNLQRQSEELKKSELRFRTIIEESLDGILIVNQAKNILFVNPAAEFFFGKKNVDLVGKKCEYDLSWEKKEELTVFVDNNDRVAELQTTRIHWQNEDVFLITIRDITIRKQVEDRLKDISRKLRVANQELEIQATIDPLTGLLNRRGLQKIIDQEVNYNKRTNVNPKMVIMDLDNFKTVNDQYGYSAGDVVLKEVSRRINQELRTTDFISRVGGDEFVIILIKAEDSDTRSIVEKIRLSINSQPILLPSGEKYCITGSFGVFSFQKKDIIIDDILKKASEYIKLSKRRGKNQISYEFSPPE